MTFKATLPSDYQNFIHLSRYSRWLGDKKRRETWDETVTRYIDFLKEHVRENVKMVRRDQSELFDILDMIKTKILKLENMGSMRALMTAGEALKRDNVAGFSCSYDAANSLRTYDEMVYILMCGAGEGFSVEKTYVNKMPSSAESFFETDTVIMVEDSKIGWAKAYREFISLLFIGQIPKWDVSRVRPKGSRLKTFGGRASGPEPLIELFKYTINTVRRFAGKQLPTIAVFDLLCKVADIVVVGGVRRSALICLSDVNDEYMRKAKSNFDVIEYTLLGKNEKGDRKYSVLINDVPYGERSLIVELDDWESEDLQSNHKLHWMHVHPERQLANISTCYDGKPSMGVFMAEWKALYDSKSGERGIVNRQALIKKACENGRRDTGYSEYGVNPCVEAILRLMQFCNLTEEVVRRGDTLKMLMEKMKFQVILGTVQSTLTKFRYLRNKWKLNTEEERLLGSSLTGIMDHAVLSGQEGEPKLIQWLSKLKEVAIEANKEWAAKMNINQSAAITCIKPSGTVSQLTDSASGIHARHSPYYIRTVRIDKKDPMYSFMVDKKFPHEDVIGKESTTAIFKFPIKSPEGSIFRTDRTAIEQLNLWMIYKEHFCEHSPSITVTVKEDEWMSTGAWVYENFDDVTGIAFLPFSEHSYKQAPYQECSKEDYEKALEDMPKNIDWNGLSQYEDEDNTEGSQSLACVGGSCEI